MRENGVTFRKVPDPYLVRDRRTYPWTIDRWLYWDEKKRKYSREPKTLHEYFESEYKEHKKYVEWKEWQEEHLTHYQDVLIDRYIREGFWLIALIRHDKHPLEPWLKYKLDLRSAMRWMLTGNLGVVCGRKSEGLVVIDFDEEPIPRVFKNFLDKTLTTKTYRGYHLFFRVNKLPKNFGDTLRNEYGRHVECKYDGQFVLLPLSVHPKSTKKNPVFYDFVDYTRPILNLEELLEVY